MDSHIYPSIGLSCFLRQLPPADLGFIVRFGTQDHCDRGHYFEWRNHRLARIECPDKDLSFYEVKSALVSIAHSQVFDRIRSQISPSRTESAVDLFRDWVILKLERKCGPSHYVITVATDDYHRAKWDPGLRMSRVEYDNTPQQDDQLVVDPEESVVSGLVEDISPLLATTIISLSACFAVRSYLPDSCSCPSVFDPRNWSAPYEDLDRCMLP